MKYNELKEISDKIILLYNKIALDKNIEIYNYSAPHIANFSNTDKVISIMGINPSVEENKRNITFNEEYDENNFIECDNDLDLYYVPRNNKFDQELNEKLKEYTCNFAHKPYTQICGSENLPFKNGDYIFVPDVRKAVAEKADVIKAYVVGDDLKEIDLRLGELTDAERQIILDGCLINYYKAGRK